MSGYTAISFAPVQGFIEKPRKLRDLYGASLILSYLSQRLSQVADEVADCKVVSPALIDVQEGMPNRILIKGNLGRNDVSNALQEAWATVLRECRVWLEKSLSYQREEFHWQSEWDKWQRYTWEVFWGQGDSPDAAMQDLERRKLKRDWTGINWIGDSSSLTGTDAIAWHRLGQENSEPGRSLTADEKGQLQLFYRRLAWVLDNPERNHAENVPTSEEQIEGKYIAVNERLSIPELVKRLVTYAPIAQCIGITELDRGFTEISREPGQWTGWFMGDGDKVGDALKAIGNDDEAQAAFSKAMRDWGQEFKQKFPREWGRVIYAGGDDFLGVFYTPKADTEKSESQCRRESQALANTAVAWLKQFKQQWQTHGQELTVSVGFVWAANRVPQRDILQHCREAEKRSKSLGRDRVTIRVLFNSGQYVQWTCPWDYLDILTKYRDRDGKTGSPANWNHLYSDWAQLKARHAIPLNDPSDPPDDRIALALFKLYFSGESAWKENSKWEEDTLQQKAEWIVGKDSERELLKWLDGLVNVGWQLCSNT